MHVVVVVGDVIKALTPPEEGVTARRWAPTNSATRRVRRRLETDMAAWFFPTLLLSVCVAVQYEARTGKQVCYLLMDLNKEDEKKNVE